jgi:hypothetical protein
MNNRIRTYVCVQAMLLALVSCGSAPQKNSTTTSGAVTKAACISVDALSQWEPLDNRTVLLTDPDNPRSHLITLATEIMGLGDANDIEIVDGDLDGSSARMGLTEYSCHSASVRRRVLRRSNT